MPSFTELQDADNEIVTTPGPNTELGTVAQLVENTNTEAPLSPTGPDAGASIKPILQLKPVPEIVKPAAPTTRRPHTFIRFRKHTLLMLITTYRVFPPKNAPLFELAIRETNIFPLEVKNT